MSWRLGDEPKKWIMDKGQPTLVNDFTVMSESTTTMPGLAQKYLTQDRVKEEQRLHKIRQSEMDSLREGVSHYGLDNPFAPIGSQTQMPYNATDFGLAVITPSMGFAVSKGAQKIVNQSLNPKVVNRVTEPIQNNAVDIWEAFNRGIKKQEQWNMAPETIAREKDALLNPIDYAIKAGASSKSTQTTYSNYMRIRDEVLGGKLSSGYEHTKSINLNADLGDALAHYRRDIGKSSIELDLSKAYNKPLDTIESAGRHEQSHYKYYGGDMYNDKTLSRFADEIPPFKPDITLTPREAKGLEHSYNYLSSPTEVHSRIDELRGYLWGIDKSFKPGVTVTPDDIAKLRQIDNPRLKRILEELAFVTKEPNSLVRLMNYLPVSGAIGLIWKENNKEQKWKMQ